jgi:hypothetical protein
MPKVSSCSTAYSASRGGGELKRARRFCSSQQKGALAVGATDRQEAAVERRVEILQVAVVGEDPVAAPQLAHEGMGVLQRDVALRRLADVGDDVLRADRIPAHQLGDGRFDGRLRIEEEAAAGALEEGDAPAVAVHVGEPAARVEALERKTDVGRRVAVHAEQLAHGWNLSQEPAQ